MFLATTISTTREADPDHAQCDRDPFTRDYLDNDLFGLPLEGGIITFDNNDTIVANEPADSIQELEAFLNKHTALRGYAVIRRNASNYRRIEGKEYPAISNGEPTSYYLFCDRDQFRDREGGGIRDRGTAKLGYPFKLYATARKSNCWRWT